jgi:hypothetical protein
VQHSILLLQPGAPRSARDKGANVGSFALIFSARSSVRRSTNHLQNAIARENEAILFTFNFGSKT